MSAVLAEISNYRSEIASMVRDVVRGYRRSGVKLQTAIELAARDLDLGVRRIRSYWYGEPVAVLVSEYFAVRERMDAHLAREAERLARQSQLLDARRALIGDGR